jgi:hypothetical protein
MPMQPLHDASATAKIKELTVVLLSNTCRTEALPVGSDTARSKPEGPEVLSRGGFSPALLSRR